MSHGGGAAGSASSDEAAGLAQGAVHQIPGALQAAKQTHPARRDPHQGHAGNTGFRHFYSKNAKCLLFVVFQMRGFYAHI